MLSLSILKSSKSVIHFASSAVIRANGSNEAISRRLLMSCLARHASAEASNTEVETKPVSTKFENRNPRNLEFLGIAWKRKGWKFQYPSREYYHRVVFERSHRHTAAYVEHANGMRVVTASTRELAIMRHLYSSNDVSAAENIGTVLAQRCRECGITSMILQSLDNSEKSEKFSAFCNSLTAGGVDLSEPEEVKPEYQPGINYDDTEAVAELERRQWLVYDLGTKSSVTRALVEQQRTRGRRRPRTKPTPLEVPTWKAD